MQLSGLGKSRSRYLNVPKYLFGDTLATSHAHLFPSKGNVANFCDTTLHSDHPLLDVARMAPDH
jgi:hypothetical protein